MGWEKEHRYQALPEGLLTSRLLGWLLDVAGCKYDVVLVLIIPHLN